MIDFNKITREEMIIMAKETRKKVTSANVSIEELAQFPVFMEKLIIETSQGETTTYYSYINDDKNMPLVINIHGGGFIRGRTTSDNLFCRKLSHKLGCKVIDIDYKIAPEYPFPTALYECVDVIKWAYKNSDILDIDKNKIIIMGHSSGGNLTSAIQMLLNKDKEIKPCCLIMDYPPFDLFTDPEDKGLKGKGIPAERARLYNLYYCSTNDRKSPLVSPVFAKEEDLKDFPPTLMITAEQDSLCAEGEEFALKLAQAGNEVTLKRFKDVSHGFTIYRMPGHEDAFKMITDFIEYRIN